MSVTVLKDVLIGKGRLANYFEGVVPVNLWRALNRKTNVRIFDFIEKGFTLSSGRPRPADIKVEP